MTNILLTGAGGGAAIGVIKSLRMSGKKYHIVVTDADGLSAGFLLANKSYVVPMASEETAFIGEIARIIGKEHIDFILPTSSFDIEPLSLNKDHLKKLGTRILINDYSTITICHDKLTTRKVLGKMSFIPGEGEYERFRFEKERNGETFKEEYLPGEEYTVDILSDMEGNYIMAVPRLRIRTLGSYTYKGEVVMDREIITICKWICNYLKLKGVNCIQLKRDKNDKPKLVEINPRFGGSTHFTTLAGANFAQMLIDIGFGKKIKIPKIKPMKIIRYFSEIIC